VKKRILITGVSGLLGNNLAHYFKDIHSVLGLYNSHPVAIDGAQTQKRDITSKVALNKAVSRFNPDIVIHCASLTDVDFCEVNRELTDRINVFGTKTATDSIRGNKAKLIYISTDSVYDGVKGNFSETDSANPLNYYGLSKYKGEQEVLKRPDSLILRTNLFGWNIQNKFSLAEWILHELSNNREIKGFKDVCFSSLYTFELAKILDEAIVKGLTGIYNCASASSLSKYDFAVHIADGFNLNKSLIKPISVDDFNFKAKRGKNLTLNIDKLTNDLNYSPPAITESIEAFYRDFKGGLPEKIKRNNSFIKAFPKSNFIPYGRQSIDENDIKAVVDVLKLTHLTQGPKVAEFESGLCDVTSARYAVAVNSGTSALHIACLAAGVGTGDEAITSTNTFVASANCIVYCGAKPVFADIDSKIYNISPAEIEKKITKNTKAIIPVHFAGQSCDMETIRQITKAHEKKYGHKIYIIADACHALGSLYKGSKVGSCTYADMAVMSFHPIKHITTGEGGVVLTNDESLYNKLKRFRSHGITSKPEEFINKNQNPWYYEQIDLGYNYRITDLQCALGLSQIMKLPIFSKRRKEIVNRYNRKFKNIEAIQTPYESPDCNSNFHLYVLLFDFKKIGIERGFFMTELKKKGIQTQVHYIPVHTQPFYQRKFHTKWGDCSISEEYYKKCLSIPLFPAMTDEDVKKVISGIEETIKTS